MSLSHVRLSVTPWTVAHQAPPSLGFSGQKSWSGLPCLPPGDLPNLGIEPRSPTLQADSLLSETPGKPKNTGVGTLPFPRGSSWLRSQTRVSCIAGGFFTSWATSEVRLFMTPGAVACQASQSTEFSRQEYWSGFPCSSPGDLPNPGIESVSLTSPALADGFFTSSATWKVFSEMILEAQTKIKIWTAYFF